jgi:predicted Zn-dependent peptidase
VRTVLSLAAILLTIGPAAALTTEELPNGARLVAVQAPSMYSTAYAVIVDADPSDEGDLHGLRSVLARASLSGVEDVDPVQVLARLQSLASNGGQVTTFAEDDMMVLAVGGPPEIEPQALEILSDALYRPAFNDVALESARSELMPQAERHRDDRFYSLLSEAREILHPSAPAVGPAGTVGGLRAIAPEDLEAAHERLMVGRRTVCIGIGPGAEEGTLDHLRSLAEGLPGGEAKPAPTPSWDPPPPTFHARVTEDRDGRLALMMMAFAVPNLGSPSWPAVEMAREILAGPAGRLTRDPRLRQYSPTLEVFLIPRARYSEMVVVAATPMPWRIESLRLEILDALSGLANEPLPPPEQSAARRRLLGEQAIRQRSALSRSIELGRIALSGGDLSRAVQAPLEALRTVDEAEVREVARTYLGPEDAALVLALPAAPPLDQPPSPSPSGPVAGGR